MRRKIAMLLCASMAIGLLAGCGGSSEESKASESKEEKGADTSDKDSGEKVKLTFWKSPHSDREDDI